MGYSDILTKVNKTGNNYMSYEHTDEVKLSHGVQGIMFWAEAGRNAYKDDGKIILIFSLTNLKPQT